jgi:hypothetical protein
MKKYILSYLTENYYLDKSEIGNAGIYAFDDDRHFKVPSNAKKLIEEIVTLFGYSFTRTKWIIHDWAKSQHPDFCLKFYWSSHEIDGNIFMPIARQVAASTIGQDLVAVRPMTLPNGLLNYIDYQYGELDHPTPDYLIGSIDPANNDPHITIAKVRNLDRNEIIRKWQASGLLDNFDGSKPSIAALYECQARQLLE